MSEEINPFAAPQSLAFPSRQMSEAMEAGEAWREGKLVVLLHGAHLPPRCWKCNADAEVQLRRRLAWHHPSWFLFLLLGLLPYLIVALLVQKKARFALLLCQQHAHARRQNILIAWALSIGGFALLIFTGSFLMQSAVYFIWTGIGLIVAGLIYGATFANVCTAKRIDSYAAWLVGAGRPYLDSLPESVARSY